MCDKEIRFISYDINTAPKDPVFSNYKMPSGIYLGLDDPKEDIEARCLLIQRAVDVAAQSIANESPLASDNTLKVFMAPEFFFRGKKGAYQMDEVSYAISSLQAFTAESKWENWVFVFGSLVATSSSTIGKDEAYNFVLIQQGGEAPSGDSGARVVMKELMSGIDFISTHANPGGVLLGEVEYLSAGDRGVGRDRQQLNYDGAGIFDLDEITWAVEVCLDHGDARLQESPQLPGENMVQIQLVPSCGMTARKSSVITCEDGLIFNCDGGGFGSTVNKWALSGSPLENCLEPVASQRSIAVNDDAIELDQSPLRSVSINELFAEGAGQVVIFPTQICPRAKVVPGKVQKLEWSPVDGTTFTFLLNYDNDGSFSTVLSHIALTTLDFHDHDYFLPCEIDTRDKYKNKVQIQMKIIAGNNGYDGAVWCDLTVPGFKFEGVAFEFYHQHGKGDPQTIW